MWAHSYVEKEIIGSYHLAKITVGFDKSRIRTWPGLIVISNNARKILDCSGSLTTDYHTQFPLWPTDLSFFLLDKLKSTQVLLLQLLLLSHFSRVWLCDPINSSPPGSPVPGILQARTLEWVAISFSDAWKWKVKVKSLSHVWLFATPWTVAYQAPLPMGFSRQEYWSGVPLLSPLRY